MLATNLVYMPNINETKSNKKRVLRVSIAIFLFIFGLVLFFYPQISDSYVAYRIRKEQSRFDLERSELARIKEEIQSEKGKWKESEQVALEKAWRDLLGKAKEQRSGTVYNSGEELLSLGNIIIPSINVNLSIHYGSSDEVLNNGAGLFEQSDDLSGGIGQRIIITAHSGLPKARYFTDLEKVRRGDYIFIENFKDTLAYQVDSAEKVLPEEVDSLKSIADEDRLTLITCTPIGINTHRFLLHAKRVDFRPEVKQVYQEAKVKNEFKEHINDSFYTFIEIYGIYILLAIASILLIVLLMIKTVVRKNKTKRRTK